MTPVNAVYRWLVEPEVWQTARVIMACALASACGGASHASPATPAAASAETAPASAPVPDPPAAAAVSGGIPTKCASPDGALCTPDVAFVKRLCNGSFPDVALVLLAKDTPFT